MSSDPNDLEVLTPGHFLVGSALLAPPSTHTTPSNISTLTRWQLVDRLHQEFWKRWSTEYLTRLQQRPKWASRERNIKINDVVLLKDEQLPSTKWALGRIKEVYPGQDGLTRVVSVYTKNGTFRRPVTKVCPLPITDNENKIKYDYKCNIVEISPVPSNKERQAPAQVDYTRLKQTALKEAKRQRRQNNPTGKKIRPAYGYPTLIPPTEQRELAQKRKNEEPTNQDNKVQRKKTCNISKVMALLLVLMITPSWAQTLKSPVEIQPFKDHPGIYFEDLGKVSLINSEWSIISYYDLTNYWKELSGIRQCVSEINHLCNITIIRKNYCTGILNQIQVQLKQFEDTNELLHNRSASSQHLLRHKRSPFDVIGTIANKLFGILDSEYASHIEAELTKAKTNDNYLLQLIKNQTSILESTVNIIKRDEASVQSQFKMISDQIRTLVNHVKSADVQLQEREATQTFNSLAVHTTLILQHYGRMQGAIMEAVRDLQHGKINPLIITPSQLRSQLSLIRSNIPNTLTVPGNEEADELFIYNLMTAKTKVTDTKILFDIKIPLTHNENYQLLKLVPVPTLHNHSFVYIKPSSDYLIINLHRDIFYPLGQGELEKCKNGRDYSYLCTQTHPMYNTNSNISRCELDILNHKRLISSDCMLKTMKPSKIWIQLHSPNTWIYVLDRQYTFTIVCGTQVIHKLLSNDGILKLRPDCVLKQDSMTISGHNLYTTHLNSSFLPSINLTEQLRTDQSVTKNFTIPEFFVRINNGDVNIHSIAQQIDKLKMKEELPRQFSPHDVHHYTISYLIILGILLFTGYSTVNKFTKWRSTRSTNIEDKPIPAPRRPRTVNSLSLEDFVLQRNTEGENV